MKRLGLLLCALVLLFTGAVATYAAPVVSTQPAITVVAAGTGTTGAVTATLAGASGRTTFICGFQVSAIGGTATIGAYHCNQPHRINDVHVSTRVDHDGSHTAGYEDFGLQSLNLTPPSQYMSI